MTQPERSAEPPAEEASMSQPADGQADLLGLNVSQGRHILMCPPDYYGIEYEINPWMDRRRPADHQMAVSQWNTLRATLEEVGAIIHMLAPVQGLPDLVFTANAALIHHKTAYISRFKHEVRQREVPYDHQWFLRHGFAVADLPEGIFFEGAGDALFVGETLVAGYRQRSDARGHQHLGTLLGVRVIPVELVDPYYYHIDTCFCPISPTQAIWYPKAFDDYGRRAIRANVPELIEVPEDEARRFACNAVVVGQTVVVNTGSPTLRDRLSAAGFQSRECPLDEFVKAGGSAKCLTLRLDGEEAAGWRAQH